MMLNIEVEELFDRILNVLDPGIAEFNHAVTVRADKVIMLPVAEGFFKLRQVLSKLMLAYQVAIDENVKSIIDSSTANTVVLVLHVHVQRFNIEVPLKRIDLFEDRITFWCFPELFGLQVRGEYLLYLVVDLSIERHEKIPRKCAD